MTNEPAAATDATANTIDSTSWAKLGFLAFLAWLAYGAFHRQYGDIVLLNDIDTAIHEFGHMLFMPFGIPIFGRTMVILGGSLFQVAFPLIFVAYFLRKRADGWRRDPYAAMICLWWTAINILDVAIYCNDARAGQLMLLNGQTGQESDGHDWNNLLTTWHLLQQDTIIARRMRAVAVLLCVGSLAAGAWIALNRRPPAPEATEEE